MMWCLVFNCTNGWWNDSATPCTDLQIWSERQTKETHSDVTALSAGRDCYLAALGHGTTVTLHTAHKLDTISCHRGERVACVSRCADAAVPPAASCGADSTRPGSAPEVVELIPSSQGSPKIRPPDLMLLLPQTNDPNGLHESDEECAGAPDTPASSMVTSASCQVSHVACNIYASFPDDLAGTSLVSLWGVNFFFPNNSLKPHNSPLRL